jgi:hypothetical protein
MTLYDLPIHERAPAVDLSQIFCERITITINDMAHATRKQVTQLRDDIMTVVGRSQAVGDHEYDQEIMKPDGTMDFVFVWWLNGTGDPLPILVGEYTPFEVKRQPLCWACGVEVDPDQTYQGACRRCS